MYNDKIKKKQNPFDRACRREKTAVNQVLRQEKKYQITAADVPILCARLGRVMMQDGHNGPLGYRVRSLYFDTPDDGDFYDKLDGLELRRKIRLRVYNPNDRFAMLEMKQKQGEYQKKRSLRLAREDAARLTQGDYRPLLRYDEPFAAECYGLMCWRCYRPRTVVEYRRTAFIARENRIRVTVDRQVAANEADYDVFSPNLPLSPVLDPFSAVLEVKYNGFLLGYIRSLLNAADRSELSVSKYYLARSVSLHV